MGDGDVIVLDPPSVENDLIAQAPQQVIAARTESPCEVYRDAIPVRKAEDLIPEGACR